MQVLRELRTDSYPGVPILRQVLRATGLPTVADILDRVPFDLHRDVARAWLPLDAAPERMRVAATDAAVAGEGGDRALPGIKGAFDVFHAAMLTAPAGAVPLAGVTSLELTCALPLSRSARPCCCLSARCWASLICVHHRARGCRLAPREGAGGPAGVGPACGLVMCTGVPRRLAPARG